MSSPEEAFKLVTFIVEAFGCPSSQYEGEAIRALLLKEGFCEAGMPGASAVPQVYIINSCTVTESAARKVRQAARRARKLYPGATVVITGCYPQVYPGQLLSQLPEVEIILGNEGREELPGLIRRRMKEKGAPAWNLAKETPPAEPLEKLCVEMDYRRARPVIKIQEGCDWQCRYCIISRARGIPRSLPREKAVQQAQNFLEKGFGEIILTGTHLGLYGKDLAHETLESLLEELERLPFDFRIRLSYIEPGSINRELLRFIGKSEKVCSYLYLPLQSGSDPVLEKMGRQYSVEDLESILKEAKDLVPGLGVQADVIVGYPGETEEDHRATLERLEKWGLSGLHVFPYSPRPQTPAYTLEEKVPPEIIKRRSTEMKELNQQLTRRFYEKMKGAVLRVLVERVEDGWAKGYSDNNAWVTFPVKKSKISLKGRLVKIRVVQPGNEGIQGELEGTAD